MDKIDFKSKFGWLTARFGRFSNGHLCVKLFQDGFPFATVGINIEDTQLDSREFHFDDNNVWSIYKDMIDCGHFEDTGREDKSGFCSYPVLRVKEHVSIS